MTLDKINIGQSCKIVKVGGYGALRRRLLDMGLTPKTIVMVRKVAPMGDPIEIYLRGYELTLRKEDARNIEVIEEKELRHDFCACRKSEFRENHVVQPTYGQQSARGEFSGRYGRKKRRNHKKK